MFDIEFVRNSRQLKEAILSGEYTGDAFAAMEQLRPKVPPVFQLETTNVCNMKCVMCPRTTKMERGLGFMDTDTFSAIVSQLEPHADAQWDDWQRFVEKDMMTNTKAYDEDYFYFMICAQTLILHGFGEPILDKTLPEKVAIAAQKGLPTYFSMNPVNIDLDKMEKLGAAGLSFLKLSLEGMDNETQMQYRGRIDKSFDDTLNKIFATIELFQKRNFKTKIILTKLNFKEDIEAQEEYIRFWKQYPVMVYVKNQHNRWLYEEEKATENTAEYLQRYCEFPWNSVSILYDGTVVPCPLEYEGILNMGNIKEQTLEEIWNSAKYQAFREMHATGNFPEGHFCKTHCDYTQLYEFTERNRKLQKQGA